ncbi:DUF1573 domain-containing protein [Planctomycetes bacterium TBK1r]|uniref:DUF1573 domain-containing protein n=1 Tax=Stieleria magnilauensis TaxID=2527963 RepID=A0ABX5Y3H5_9BACT|nr:hypothetical protein TBK1r_75910 [Planctomycetes bacterium TBK1r]
MLVRMSFWGVAITSLLTIIAVAEEAKPTQEILLSKTEVSQLPLFGTIMVSDGPTESTVDLGKSFSGTIHQGRVIVNNDATQPVRVGNMITSCGCTLATPEDGSIAPGDQKHVLLQVAKRGVGNFSEKVSLELAGRFHTINLKGRLAPRVTCADELVFPDGGTGSIEIVMHDENYRNSALEFEVSGGYASIVDSRTIGENTKLTFQWTDDTRFIDNLQLRTFVLRPNRERLELTPLLIPLKHPGRIRSVPSTVFIHPDKDFRLFLFGDIESIASKAKEGDGTLKIGLKSVSENSMPIRILTASAVSNTKSVILTFSGKDVIDLKDGETLLASCEDIEFRFKVRSLEKGL